MRTGRGQDEKTAKDESCCAPGGFGSCKVDSLVSVDEGKLCCISLIKAEEFGGMVKGLLGPLMGDVLKNI